VTKDPLGAKKYVTYLGEVVQLYGNLTAMQNLTFFTELNGKTDIPKKVYRDCLRRVSLPERFFETRVKNFSKGMRQRVGLATVLMKDALAILLDEPTSGLDPRGAEDLLDTLRELRDQGKAIFIATHDIFRAKEISDRVGIMKQGVLAMVLDREDLEEEDLSKVYLEYMRGWGVD
jgi:ABC-2 type transport system ATP-binding protein